MSRALLYAEGEHLHSPVDDLEGFFWVALWSVLFNVTGGPYSEGEMKIRNALQNNQKDAAMTLFTYLVADDKERSHATRRFEDFILDWWKTVQNQRLEWEREVIAESPMGAGKGYYLPHFHRFALRGVLDILKLLKEHGKGEISWGSWTAP